MHILSLFLSYVKLSDRVKGSSTSCLNCIIFLESGFALKYTPFTIGNEFSFPKESKY